MKSDGERQERKPIFYVGMTMLFVGVVSCLISFVFYLMDLVGLLQGELSSSHLAILLFMLIGGLPLILCGGYMSRVGERP